MGKYIKTYYPKDESFFKVLSISGAIKETDANKINISSTRLNNMVKEGLLKRTSYPSNKSKVIPSEKCFVFTNKGKKFVNKEFGIRRCQGQNALRHNCKVAESLCSLSKAERDSAIPEWTIGEMMQEKLNDMLLHGEEDRYDEYMELWKKGAISAVDYLVTTKTGMVQAFEITTGNYGQTEIEAKEMCCELLEVQKIEYISV